MSMNEKLDKNVLFDKTPSHCKDCKHANLSVKVFPCSDCRYGCISRFEWKEKQNEQKGEDE